MKELLNLIGVIPAMNTPFTADDRIDLDGLQRHTAYAVDSGVAAIMIPVVASEVGTLAPDERESIIAATLEVTRGKIPVIGGATAETKEQCLAYVRALTEAGCEGVLANIPYENDEQYADYVRAIDALHPGFLMIQDYNLSGGGVPADLLARLFEEVESFRCLKIETNLPGPKFTKMLKATGGRLNISGGWSINQYIEGLDRGVHAMVPTCMHEVYVKLDSLYRAGHRDAAWRLYRRIQPVIGFSNQDPDISKHFYKRMMWRMGYYATERLRVKTIDYDPYFQRIGDEMIDLYLEVSEEVKSGVYDV
ncbi:MAG: dihydrodipicolinate synthase family protein [Clostridia bacterium]|nr:dihydrodipicolinate synthase family protein [Clostridia bacterium]